MTAAAGLGPRFAEEARVGVPAPGKNPARSHLLPAALLATLLATSGLGHAFESLAWTPRTALFVAIPFALGWVCRRLGVPAFLGFLIALVGLAAAVVVAFVPSRDWFGVEAVRTVRDLVDAATTNIREQAAPVPVTADLLLISCAGAYAVAMLVDLVVFRVRRPALAGLPLLAFYAIPSSLAREGAVVPFVLAALGYVGLLVAEGRERTRRWGRRLAGVGVADDLVDLRPVARTGRRLGVAAIGLAVVVPVFAPDLGHGALGNASGSPFGGGSGPSSVSVVNPIVNLQPQLRDNATVELMRMASTANIPPYLRLTSLDVFNGSTWSQSQLTAPTGQRVAKKILPLPPGLADETPAHQVNTSVSVGGLNVPWLPAPYAPMRVRADGDWRYDTVSRTVFSARVKTLRKQYSIESLVADPTPAALDAQPIESDPSFAAFRRVPGQVPQIVVDALREAGVRAEQTPYQRVLAIQAFLRGPTFTYTLEVRAGTSTDALVRFLREREGYCEQFAATMAYLARVVGIPARVAIGFTPGHKLPDGSWTITNKDAHAWPEIYFPTAGWLPFEPTKRTDSLIDIPAYAQTVTIPGPTPQVSPSPTAQPSPGPSSTASAAPNIRDPDLIRQQQEAESAARAAAARNRVVLWVGIGLLVVLVVFVLPSAARALRRRRRWRHAHDPVAQANVAWRAFAEDAADVGFPLRTADSPRTAATRLTRGALLGDDGAAAVTLLARAEEQARYAPRPPAQTDLDRAVRTARRSLLATRGRRRRILVRVFPPTIFADTRVSLGTMTDRVFDSWARIAAAIRRRVIPHWLTRS